MAKDQFSQQFIDLAQVIDPNEYLFEGAIVYLIPQKISQVIISHQDQSYFNAINK